FRYLKTDLVPLSREAVDRLEEYVHAHGIRGRSLFLGPPWAYVLRDDPEEDPEIAIRRVHEELSSRNADRDQAAGALRRLDRIWFPDGKTDRPHRPTGRQIAVAIARLLEDLGVPDRLREWRQDAWKAGRITEAREHEQAWQA